MGAWFSVDEKRGSIVSVHEGCVAIVGSTDLGMSDVSDTGYASLAVRLENDVTEFFRSGQTTTRFDVDLVGLVTGNRRSVQNARRNLEILCAQGGENLRGTKIMGSNFIRVEPNPHRVFAAALKLYIADALKARQRILHMKGRVVG